SSFHDAKECLICELRLHSGPSLDEFREIAELRSAACHDDSMIDDIGGQFRRRLLKYILDGIHHFAEFARDRAYYFICFYFRGARKPGQDVAPLDVHSKFFLERKRGTNA